MSGSGHSIISAARRVRGWASALLRDLRHASGVRVTFGVLIMVGSAAVVAPFTPLGVPEVVKPLLGIWGVFGVLAGGGVLVGEVGRVRRERNLRKWLDQRATERLREQVRDDPGRISSVPPPAPRRLRRPAP